jgi:hypothetical protein
MIAGIGGQPRRADTHDAVSIAVVINAAAVAVAA